MNSFYRRSACNGVSPVSQSLKVLYKRDHLMHRLLEDRKMVRVLSAPAYFGKTSILAEYAKEFYSFRDVYWFNAGSPEFLSEIDKGGFCNAIRSLASNKSLIVFQNLPNLDNERLLAVLRIVDEIVSWNWEVLISINPEFSFVKEANKNYSVIHANELLLTAAEVAQLEDEDLQRRRRTSTLSDCFKIPGFCWSDVKHTEDLLLKIADSDMHKSRFAILFISVVLQKFSYSDLRTFFKDAYIPCMHDFSQDYPFVCANDKAGTYECYPFEMAEVKKAFSPQLVTILEQLQFSHVDELIASLADWLMASKDYKRASSLVAEFMTCERSAIWYARNSEELFLNVCILDYMKFFESTQIKNPDVYSTLYAQQSLNLALVHNFKGSLECSTKLLNYREYEADMVAKASMALDQCSLGSPRLATEKVIKRSQQGEGWKVFEELKLINDGNSCGVKRLNKNDSSAILKDIISDMQQGQFDLAYFKWVTLSDLQSNFAYDLAITTCERFNTNTLEVLIFCSFLRKLALDKKIATDVKSIREQRRLKARKPHGTIIVDNSDAIYSDGDLRYQVSSAGRGGTSGSLRGLLREYFDDHSFLNNELTLEDSLLVDELVVYLNRAASENDFNLLNVLVLAEVINLLNALRADDAGLIKFMRDYDLQIDHVLGLIEKSTDEYSAYAYTKAIEALSVQRGDQVVKLGNSYAGRQSVPQLYIKTFGEFEMSIGGERIGTDNCKRRKAQTLLSMLIVANGREISRNDIILALWPDSSYKSGERGFYSLWSELRTLLGVKDASCPYITRTQFGCKAQMDCLISDYTIFEEACESLVLGRVSLDGIPDVLAIIENMYQGEFMPSDTDIMRINNIRTECDRMRVNSLVIASEALVSAGRVQQGLWYANRAHALNRTREDVCLALMKAMVGCGQRTNAIDVYMELRKYLIDELGIETSKETDAVYDGIINSRSNSLIIDTMRGSYHKMNSAENETYDWAQPVMGADMTDDGAALYMALDAEKSWPEDACTQAFESEPSEIEAFSDLSASGASVTTTKTKAKTKPKPKTKSKNTPKAKGTGASSDQKPGAPSK